MTTDEADDLIVKLGDAVARGEVTQAWAVEHGADRIHQAWRITSLDICMGQIICLLGIADFYADRGWLYCHSRCARMPCSACADTIRRLVPELTLEMVLERRTAAR